MGRDVGVNYSGMFTVERMGFGLDGKNIRLKRKMGFVSGWCGPGGRD